MVSKEENLRYPEIAPLNNEKKYVDEHYQMDMPPIGSTKKTRVLHKQVSK